LKKPLLNFGTIIGECCGPEILARLLNNIAGKHWTVRGLVLHTFVVIQIFHHDGNFLSSGNVAKLSVVRTEEGNTELAFRDKVGRVNTVLRKWGFTCRDRIFLYIEQFHAQAIPL
jgi:hypothetical protein